MIKLKKMVTFSFALSLLCAPIAAQADTLDDKINEQDQKIEQLQKNQTASEHELATIKENVSQIEKESYKILQQKNTEEQTLTDLIQKIADLKEKIAKREEQIQKQARNVQTNQNASDILSVMAESDSINEAITKAYAVTKLISANKEIMSEQQKDQAELETLQNKSEEKLHSLTETTNELQAKQEELTKAKLDQEVKINELSASLATEKKQKEKFEKQKVEAEKKRQEQLKALAKQRAAEEAARKKAEEDARKFQEQQQKELAAAAEKERIANEEQAQTLAVQQEQKSDSSNEMKTKTNTEDSSPVSSVPEVPEEDNVTKPEENTSGWSAPLSSLVITSPFGNRVDPTGASGTSHDGIDLAGASGTPVFAAKAGKVVEAGYHWSAGNHVIIQHADGYYSYYMHLSSFSTTVGASVSAGTLLGGMGTTGNSTGVHLHFGISTSLWSNFVDPAPLLGI